MFVSRVHLFIANSYCQKAETQCDCVLESVNSIKIKIKIDIHNNTNVNKRKKRYITIVSPPYKYMKVDVAATAPSLVPAGPPKRNEKKI